MNNEQVRIFFAWKPTDELLDQAELVTQSDPDSENVRWVDRENLHITLYFIGDVYEEKINDIITEMDHMYNTLFPFELHFDTISLKGKPGKPSMIWMSFHRHEFFRTLHHKLRDMSTAHVEPPKDFKDPIPHITLARLGRRFRVGDIELPEVFIEGPQVISKIELWKTLKVNNRSKYTSLHCWDI